MPIITGPPVKRETTMLFAYISQQASQYESQSRALREKIGSLEKEEENLTPADPGTRRWELNVSPVREPGCIANRRPAGSGGTKKRWQE